jgi:hypothetical protein
MYDAAARGDVAAFVGSVSEDLLLREPAFLPFGGTYHGRDGFAAMLAKASSVLDVSSLSLEQITVEGEHAFAVFRVRAQGSDAELVVGEQSVVRDGHIVDLRIFIHDGGPLVPVATGSTS